MGEISDTQKARCLVVEDEQDVAELVGYALTDGGYAVHVAPSGEAAIDMCRDTRPDVVILDLDLPGMNGHETARQLRSFSDSYIVMLSGHGQHQDRLEALESTVDDYVPKPFSRAELVARVNALMRRPRRLDPASSSGDSRITVSDRARTASIEDTALPLTALEFELVNQLVKNMPAPVEKSQLIESGWGNANAATPHILNVHIHNLRKKVGAVDTDITIESVRGVGFRLYDKRAR